MAPLGDMPHPRRPAAALAGAGTVTAAHMVGPEIRLHCFQFCFDGLWNSARCRGGPPGAGRAKFAAQSLGGDGLIRLLRPSSHAYQRRAALDAAAPALGPRWGTPISILQQVLTRTPSAQTEPPSAAAGRDWQPEQCTAWRQRLQAAAEASGAAGAQERMNRSLPRCCFLIPVPYIS